MCLGRARNANIRRVDLCGGTTTHGTTGVGLAGIAGAAAGATAGIAGATVGGVTAGTVGAAGGNLLPINYSPEYSGL